MFRHPSSNIFYQFTIIGVKLKAVLPSRCKWVRSPPALSWIYIYIILALSLIYTILALSWISIILAFKCSPRPGNTRLQVWSHAAHLRPIFSDLLPHCLSTSWHSPSLLQRSRSWQFNSGYPIGIVAASASRIAYSTSQSPLPATIKFWLSNWHCGGYGVQHCVFYKSIPPSCCNKNPHPIRVN